MALPYVKVVRAEIVGVKVALAFSFLAAPHLCPAGLEVIQRVFAGHEFKRAYMGENDLDVWVDYDGVDLDDRMVDGLIGQVAQEVGFTLIEPVPLDLVSEHLAEAMRPHTA